MDVRVGLWRKLSTKELMLLNCGVGEDSWESLGQQGDPTTAGRFLTAWATREAPWEVHIPFLLLFLLLYPNVLSNRHSFVYLFSEQLLRAPLYLTNCLFLGAYESVITDDWSYFKFMSTKVTWVLLRVSTIPWLGDNHLLPVPLHCPPSVYVHLCVHFDTPLF